MFRDKKSDREILSINEINGYIHCKKCSKELPKGDSQLNYSRLSAGFTNVGLQVWCERHDCNVINIDFEGYLHPANLNCEA